MMLSREQIRRFFSRPRPYQSVERERLWGWGYAGVIFPLHQRSLGFMVRGRLDGRRCGKPYRWASIELNLVLVKLYCGVNWPSSFEKRAVVLSKAQQAARKAR